MKAREKVLVAMSGGVDSSVAALLLKEQGYDVVGAHMKLWDYVDVGADIFKDGRCCTIDSVTDCRIVCDSIAAPFYVLNMSKEFKATVIDDFVSEYHKGRTPNPCVRCNSDVKWNEFLHKAEKIGCDYIATGHYAIIEQNKFKRWHIRKGIDDTRDQSYVLWGVTQRALSKTLMPLGNLLKSEVREIAHKHNLRTADKPESREICFVADNNYRRFLRDWEEKHGSESVPGQIVHENGEVMGQHNGIAHFTVGQRKGLGITHPTPLYVQRVEVDTHRVIVGDNDSLFVSKLEATAINWIGGSADNGSFEAEIKIRYLHTPAAGKVTPHSETEASIVFTEPQRAVTSGQSVVFYEGDIVLGGGIIDRA
ncbi:MAG: tRNA 2-thiouridine(34) synthase MnmA [candidate division Zixibacteria bacterium]|nr:tRNA 2-thiouridine(34) synthase MnmA [candidate division Zixibacteria bacterium]